MSPSFGLRRIITQFRKVAGFPISASGINDQSLSLLFGRLPTEIRHMIWQAYFGAHAVHIFGKEKGLRARECVKWPSGGDHETVFVPGPHFGECTRPEILCNKLTLLLTCKRIYFECITPLYRETFFDFSHGPGNIPRFAYSVPAIHVAQITQINLNWEVFWPLFANYDRRNPQRDEKLWPVVWDALAAMEGLQWLRVELKLARPHQAPEWTEIECTLWRRLRKVTRPSHFELVLPWPAAVSTDESTLPCTIIRPIPTY